MNNQVDQEIIAKDKTAPRITPEHIEDVISSEHYFTALDGVDGYFRGGPEAQAVKNAKSLGLLTFCVLVLNNGFTVTGESACASPENFDAEIGRTMARQNALNKVWSLEGYLLKQKLYDNC
ncbi:Gp49 family protein [Xenorhabdus nematophila]|uniref:Gp49 family protein n=1 Tax=Xenorhabdus nematophila TaxID=628 RepID=UPI0032B87678